jgi:hypothetical protein
MSTYEEELKQIKTDIQLIEAELDMNVEEVNCLMNENPPKLEGGYQLGLVKPRQRFELKRIDYLRLRSDYLRDKLVDLKKKEKGKIEMIAWEKRTR